MTKTTEEPIFRNCNVCGRELIREDEFQIGMCAICANEPMPKKRKRKKSNPTTE